MEGSRGVAGTGSAGQDEGPYDFLFCGDIHAGEMWEWNILTLSRGTEATKKAMLRAIINPEPR